MNSNNTDIRFPLQSYVGLDPRSVEDDTLPLGFMTEDGTDKAAEKRKGTVDRWAAGKATPRTLPNEPMVGLRLSRQIRRYSGWGSGNVKWRIEDPRGFELEITSPNLAQIIANCTIRNGEILDECQWARLKGDNALVPVNSELYETTKKNSERLKMSVKPSSVKIGNRIILKNGNEGIYCGKMYRCYVGSISRRAPDDKAEHIILGEKNGKPLIHSYATLKPAKILDDGLMTVFEAETLLNTNDYRFWSANIVEIPPIQLRPLTEEEVLEYGFRSTVVAQVEEFDNEWAIFYASMGTISLKAVEIDDLRNHGKITYKWNGKKYTRDTYRETKSIYLKVDYTKIECFGLFRDVTTEAGYNKIIRVNG